MSVWTTKSLGRDQDYIVLRHTLRGVNYVVNGVKFRNGFAVVSKNSKEYYFLKRIPVLKKAEEFPLIHLRSLSFITRTLDVKTIYGRDVYVQYLKELDKELKVEKTEAQVQKEIVHVQEKKLCSRKFLRDGNEEMCRIDATEESPSGYCKKHVLQDPKLKDLGIDIPLIIPKNQRKEFAEKVLKKLSILKSEGKF